MFSMTEKYLISLCCFTRSSLTIVLWKKINIFLCEFKFSDTSVCVFYRKNKVFLNRTSPLWSYFPTYSQGLFFVSPLFCGMFQTDISLSPRGLLQLQHFQVFISGEIWLAGLDQFLWDIAVAIFNDENLFSSFLKPFAEMEYHFTWA